jgi:hypothetical protein
VPGCRQSAGDGEARAPFFSATFAFALFERQTGAAAVFEPIEQAECLSLARAGSDAS